MDENSLSPIARISLREHAYDVLRRAIVSGELAPGQRLRDQELAARLGVSRTPVREALQRLEDEGLVETRAGAATRVVPLDTPGARDAFPVVAALHALATRLAVGRLAVGRLAPDDQGEVLGEVLEEMRRANEALAEALAARTVADAIAADDRFHAVLVCASGNREIAPALARLTPKIRRLEVAQFGSLAGRRSVRQHEAILAACARGDAAAAAELAERNWLSLGQLIAESLARQAAPPIPREDV